MPTLWCALVAVWALGQAAAATPPDADFSLIRDWDPVGTDVAARAERDTLLLTAGTIQTGNVYKDFAFRFDYRLPSAHAGGELRLGARTEDGADRVYTVALEGNGGSGRLSAEHAVLHQTRFTPLDGPRVQEWVPSEIRIESGRLTVTLGGTIVARADRLDTVPGRLGFRAVRPGGLELRGMRVAKLVPTPSTFHTELPKAEAPGITPPQVARQAYPKYPESARRQRISGAVLVEMVIEADGRLGDVQVVETPHPDLVGPALECVRKWRFKPALQDGTPIAVTATMEIAFTLKDR